MVIQSAGATAYAGPLTEAVAVPSGRVTFKSDLQATVVLPASAADLSLPSVVVPTTHIPQGSSIVRVYCSISWRKQVDSSGSPNAVDGAQSIQIQKSGAAAWTDAIDMPDNTLSTSLSSTEGGDLVLGDNDVLIVVDRASTYDFQWEAALVDGASLTLHDVQLFITIDYAGPPATPSTLSGRVMFKSDLQATVILPAVAADLSLPSVVVPTPHIPSGATIARVYAGVSWRKQIDSSASSNAVDGAQTIQIQEAGGGSWTDAIDMPDNTLSTAGETTEGGDLILGDIDVAAVVTGAATFDFQWADALVDGASLTLYDVQTFIIIDYA